MTHVFTKIRNADRIWIKGIRQLLQLSGGGRLEHHRKHGVDVYAANPESFNYCLDKIKRIGQHK